MKRENREVWGKRVERWRDSGLTAKEFADEIGVNANTLSYWKWRVGRESGVRDSAAGLPRSRPVARARAVQVPFVEVSSAPVSAAALREEECREAEPIEIVAPSGLRVRVPARFDDGALTRILQAVR
jgi:transposase